MSSELLLDDTTDREEDLNTKDTNPKMKTRREDIEI
jgi:hypothetical protein